MTNIAIYPGTFDPITNGHSDLVERAARLFDKVIVGVAVSTHKKTVFTLEERLTLARKVLQGHPNVEVCALEGLLVKFAQQRGANIIIRGLRAASDFEYEFQLAGMNRNLKPDIETLFLTPSDQYMFISASMIREIAQLGGDVSPFVHPLVVQRLNEKIIKN